MKNSEVTDYHISVYPGGQGWGKEPIAQIYFRDKETKENYVLEEAKFCKGERAAFNGAMSTTEREECRRKLLQKRAVFAQKMGYGRSLRDHNVWIHKPPRGKMNA